MRSWSTPATSSTVAALLSLLITLSAPWPAEAHNEIGLRFSSTMLADSGIFALAKHDRVAQAELSYARALFDPQRGLWIEASWMIGRVRADLFGDEVEATGLFQSFSLGTRYTLPLTPWLVPQMRAGLGLSTGDVSLLGANVGGRRDSVSSSTELALGGYLLAGLELLLPRRWMYRATGSGFTGGLTIEGGVTFTTPMRFELAPEPDDELRTIPLSGVDIGSLTVSGAVLRVGVVMRF